MHLVYQADTSALTESNRAAAVEATRTNIERRVNSLGVSEPIIQTSKMGSEYRLIVELAGITDINQATSLIGQTAQLEFRSTQTATPSSAADFISTGLTGRDLTLAQIQFNGGKVSRPARGRYRIFSRRHQKFAEITGKSIGQPLAIFLDNQLVTAPPFKQPLQTAGLLFPAISLPMKPKNLRFNLTPVLYLFPFILLNSAISAPLWEWSPSTKV